MKELFKDKKPLFISMVLVVVLVVIGVSFLVYNTLKPKTYTEISYSELKELVNGHDKFILFIGSNSCSHCTVFKVAVNEIVQKYNVEIDYIDVSKLSADEIAYLNSNFAFSGTPTTVLVSSGKKASTDRVLYKIRGQKTFEEFEKILDEYGFINKK